MRTHQTSIINSVKLEEVLLLPKGTNARIELWVQGERAKWLALDENRIEEKKRETTMR